MQFRWQILISLSLGSLKILVAGLLADCTRGAPTANEAAIPTTLPSEALQTVCPLRRPKLSLPPQTLHESPLKKDLSTAWFVISILQDNQMIPLGTTEDVTVEAQRLYENDLSNLSVKHLEVNADTLRKFTHQTKD